MGLDRVSMGLEWNGADGIEGESWRSKDVLDRAKLGFTGLDWTGWD